MKIAITTALIISYSLVFFGFLWYRLRRLRVMKQAAVLFSQRAKCNDRMFLEQCSDLPPLVAQYALKLRAAMAIVAQTPADSFQAQDRLKEDLSGLLLWHDGFVWDEILIHLSDMTDMSFTFEDAKALWQWQDTSKEATIKEAGVEISRLVKEKTKSRELSK